MTTRWIRVTRETRDGRPGRRLDVHDAEGTWSHSAFATTHAKEVALMEIATGRVACGWQRRATFPFTGKLDAYDGAGSPLGVLSRNRSVTDRDGMLVARFRDARSFGSHVGEGLGELLASLAVGGGDDHAGAMPKDYVIAIDGKLAGQLVRAAWPFARAVTVEPEPRGLRRWIPKRVRAILRSVGAPACWRFELTGAVAGELLLLAAAVWTVELSHW